MATKGDPGVAGRHVLQLRKRRGLTAEALADRIPDPSMTKTVITNLESGRKKDLSATELFQVASALGVSPVILMVDADGPFAPVEIAGLAEPYSKMCLAEYLVAIGQQPPPRSWSSANVLLVTMSLFEWLRPVEADIERHEAISRLTSAEREAVLDGESPGVRRADGTPIGISVHDLEIRSWGERVSQIVMNAWNLARNLEHFLTQQMEGEQWLVDRINRALDVARRLESEDRGEPSTIPRVGFVDDVGLVLRGPED